MEERFPKNLQALDSVFRFLDEFIVTHRVDDSAAYPLRLAVEEFFTNIIKYGMSKAGEVSITAVHEGGRVVVEITDPDSASFDPTSVDAPPRDLPLGEQRVGGLGIFLSRQMLDDVQYHHTGRTARITLVKNLEK
jgi:serine/threonine-protein kinase RsbW